MSIPVIPREDILDARIVPTGANRLRIEFNPNRSRGRVRFSVAHEIAHSLFPDCAYYIRNRDKAELGADDNWQLEMLCNLAAAEFLMPFGSGAALESEAITIDNILRLQAKYEVSTEAMSIKLARITADPCVVFAAKRQVNCRVPGFTIDYSVPSRSATLDFPRGLRVGGQSILSNCTAVGYTAKGTEHWAVSLPELYIECVGVPPYRGHQVPRVVGVARATGRQRTGSKGIMFLKGDAIEASGSERTIIAQVVTDKTMNWGGHGFAYDVKKRLPEAQDDFQKWVQSNPANLSLGKTHVASLPEGGYVASMIAQHGYGPSLKPRIRYSALAVCLEQLAEVAVERKGTIHMPRIGTGAAGGNWAIIQDLIQDILLRRGVEVTVYDLPWGKSRETQAMLKLE